MLRLQGHTVELIRWVITYTMDDLSMTETAAYEDERDAILDRLQAYNPIVETLDVSDALWIEGLEFNTWDDANNALQAGPENYIRPISYDDVVDLMRILLKI